MIEVRCIKRYIFVVGALPGNSYSFGWEKSMEESIHMMLGDDTNQNSILSNRWFNTKNVTAPL